MKVGAFLKKWVARWTGGAREAAHIPLAGRDLEVPSNAPPAPLDTGSVPASRTVPFAHFDTVQAEQSTQERPLTSMAFASGDWEEFSRRLEEQSRRICPSLYDEEGNRMG